MLRPVPGRSSGQIYRAGTIPQAIELNAMLPKNQIICCGTMNVSFLKFQPLIWPMPLYLDSRRTRLPWPWHDAHARAASIP
jgi:hypothetical protein